MRCFPSFSVAYFSALIFCNPEEAVNMFQLHTASFNRIYFCRFLKHIGRAQYDPTKENYVSMEMLARCDDFKFATRVAKVPVKVFMDFIKTM